MAMKSPQREEANAEASFCQKRELLLAALQLSQHSIPIDRLEAVFKCKHEEDRKEQRTMKTEVKVAFICEEEESVCKIH